jgi:hypothetical protein
MDEFDLDTLQRYMVGMHVYSVYEKETGGIDITGDQTSFYFILGTIIKDTYPQCYQNLLTVI